MARLRIKEGATADEKPPTRTDRRSSASFNSWSDSDLPDLTSMLREIPANLVDKKPKEKAEVTTTRKRVPVGHHQTPGDGTNLDARTERYPTKRTSPAVNNYDNGEEHMRNPVPVGLKPRKDSNCATSSLFLSDVGMESPRPAYQARTRAPKTTPRNLENLFSSDSEDEVTKTTADIPTSQPKRERYTSKVLGTIGLEEKPRRTPKSPPPVKRNRRRRAPVETPLSTDSDAGSSDDDIIAGLPSPTTAIEELEDDNDIHSFIVNDFSSSEVSLSESESELDRPRKKQPLSNRSNFEDIFDDEAEEADREEDDLDEDQSDEDQPENQAFLSDEANSRSQWKKPLARKKSPVLEPKTPSRDPTVFKTPKKGPRIPLTPHRHDSDEFWDQTVHDEWVDQHGPQKTMSLSEISREIARLNSNKKVLLDAAGLPAKNTALKRSKSPAKDAEAAERRERRKFEDTKQSVAEAFLKELDSKIGKGIVSRAYAKKGGIQLRFNTRLLTTAGRTFPVAGNIELSPKVITNFERLHDTTAHEYCHLLAYTIDKTSKQHHGPEFKKWQNRCAERYGHLGVTRNTLHRYEIETKYHYECQTRGCTYLHKRHGKLPNIERKRCPLCRGVLLQTKPAVKALSAYNVFAKENISRIARENPNTPRKELWTILGQDWKKHQQDAAPGVELNGNVETDEVEGKYYYACQGPGCQYFYKRQTKLPDMEKRICPLCGAMLLQIKPAPKAFSAQDPFTKGNTSRRTPLTELSVDGQMGATQESPVKAGSRTEVIVLTESDDDLEARIASLKL